MEPFAIYTATRARILDLALGADESQLSTMVPACPEWRVRDLLAHCVAIPASIGAGDLPTGDLQEWLDRIVADRADRSVTELAAEWAECDPTIEGMMAGGGAVLCDDVVVHEHDLRGALGRPDRTLVDPDASVRSALAACVAPLGERGLGAIEVRDGSTSWVSHDAPIGWTIEASPWEAVRALSSRRTADELRALGGSDDLEPFIAVLDAHLPLPVASLGER